MDNGLKVSDGASEHLWSRSDLVRLAEDGELDVSHLLPESATATHVSFESVAGDYRVSVPLEVARSQGVVLVGDDLRLQVRDGATLCWNVKELGSIRLTVGPEPDSVPENPPH